MDQCQNAEKIQQQLPSGSSEAPKKQQRKRLPLAATDFSEEDQEKFWSRVDKTPHCWNWITTTSRASFSTDNGHYTSRRVSWCLCNGPVPSGNCLENTCGNLICVRPDHARIVPLFKTWDREYHKQYRKNNAEKVNTRIKQWRDDNPDKIREYARRSGKKYIKNGGRIKKLERQKQRAKTDPIFRMKRNLRSKIWDILKRKNFPKTFSAYRIIGCTGEYLKEHIQKQFQPGMSWDNYGKYGWHIDHVIPIGPATTIEEVKDRSHYKNLQPLWAKDNIKKSDRIHPDYMNEKPTIRASEMARTLACPGSARLTRIVKRRDRNDGHEGSAIHHAIALRLIKDHGAIGPDGGLQAPDIPVGYKIPANSEWMIDWAIRHILETVPADWSLMVETESIHDFKRWRMSAHRDWTAQSPCGKKIKAGDWKTGVVPVDPADENDQVLTYEVSIKLDWPEVEEIEFEICQPRLPFEERISRSVITGAEIDACVASLDARAVESIDDSLTLNTGKKQCLFCVGVSCPAIRAELNNMKLTLTEECITQMAAEPNDGLLADFVITARTLKRPIDDATEMLHERLERVGQIISDSGATVQGYVQKGSYEVLDPVEFINTVRQDFPTDEQLAPLVSFSMTAVKDGLAKVYNLPKTSKNGDSADSMFESKYRSLVTQGVRKMLRIT